MRSAIVTIFCAHKKYLIASLAPCVPDSRGLSAMIWGISADRIHVVCEDRQLFCAQLRYLWNYYRHVKKKSKDRLRDPAL